MVSREREKVTLFLVVSGLMPTNYFVTVAPVCFYLRGDNCINLNKPLLLSRSSNAWMMVRLVFEYRRSNINKNRWNPMLGFTRSRPLCSNTIVTFSTPRVVLSSSSPFAETTSFSSSSLHLLLLLAYS